MKYDLSKFVLAHRSYYSTALSEMKNGRKASHWMWYIFPQLKGLGKSSTSSYYGITDLEEAKDFLNDAYLGSNLLEISSALLEIECNDASKVMGKPDDLFFRQICRGDAESICFSCSKDIGKYEVVCMRERLCEFMEERFCPCISMRLEYTPHTVVQRVLRCF